MALRYFLAAILISVLYPHEKACAQSPCIPTEPSSYIVILGPKTSDDETEDVDYYRTKSPMFSSFESEGNKLNGWSITNFGPCKNVVSTASQLEIQIKHGKLGR